MAGLALLKVGGAELQEGPTLDLLADALAAICAERQLIVVHGGGKDIARLQERLGLEPRFLEGLRITDEASLEVAEMVLSGSVNKRLTARLVTRGVRAIGLSGVDAGLLRAEHLIHPKGDLGRVGEITHVETNCLQDLLSGGFTPVVSPISLGMDGRPYNVNADHAALAIAASMQVAEMVLLTDVPGVMYDGSVLATLNRSVARAMMDDGHITGGMIPKVRSALEAIDEGVGTVRIVDLAGLSQGAGTLVTA